MPSENTRDTWSDWRNHVIRELERLNKEIDKLNEKINTLEIQVAKLQVKASIWGGVTGLVTTLIALVLHYLKTAG